MGGGTGDGTHTYPQTKLGAEQTCPGEHSQLRASPIQYSCVFFPQVYFKCLPQSSNPKVS